MKGLEPTRSHAEGEALGHCVKVIYRALPALVLAQNLSVRQTRMYPTRVQEQAVGCNAMLPDAPRILGIIGLLRYGATCLGYRKGHFEPLLTAGSLLRIRPSTTDLAPLSSDGCQCV